MNLELFVSHRKLTKKGFSTPVADTAEVDTFTITFDKEWDGLVKLVELRNGEASAQVFYNGKTPLPRQVCGRGELYFVCHGYRKKGDSTAVVRTIPMVRPVYMAGTSRVEGSEEQPYTPSAFDQMAAKVAQAEQIAQEAGQIARELLAMKEAGAFVGPAGSSATVQVEQTVRQGMPARVDNLGTAGHALLRFTLPYGMTQAEKTAMAEQIKEMALGDVDTALAEILAIQEVLLQTHPGGVGEEAME